MQAKILVLIHFVIVFINFVHKFCSHKTELTLTGWLSCFFDVELSRTFIFIILSLPVFQLFNEFLISERSGKDLISSFDKNILQ